MSVQRTPSLAHWGAFTAVVERGRLIACEPFAHDPHPSPMLRAIPEMVHSPVRIARPAVRAGWLRERHRSDGAMRGRERFVEVGWDTLIDLIAGELARVRAEHGAEGIFGGSQGWGSAGRLHHSRTLARRFLFAGGGCVDQVGNYSWGTAQYLLPRVVGTYDPVSGRVTHWPDLARHTRLFVAFGGLALKNGQVGSGGVGEHNMLPLIRAVREGGCRFVVVSPTRADCPAVLDAEWIPIRPRTDTAFMLAMAHVLWTEGRADRAFVDRYCEGFDRFLPYLTGERDGVPKSPEWAAPICDVPADTIRTLARRLVDQRTMLSATYSLQRARHGEQPYWMLVTLAALVGQIGLPGGGFGFGHGSMHGIGNPRPDVSAPSLSMGVNPIGRAIPCARISDMLLSPGAEYEFDGRRETYPHARLVYWAGGNPYHHHQDLNRLRRAWARPETVIVHDAWWTATARHADIVVPATTMVERNDVGGGARDRFIFAMHRAIDPVGGARNDFDVFRELAARGGFEQRFTEGRDEAGWTRAIYEQAREANARAGVDLPPFEAFWAQGYAEQERPAEPFVLFSEFRADPAAHPLATPSGRIEIFSRAIEQMGYDDCPPHPTWIAPEGLASGGGYPLAMVTIQPPDRLHGQMDPGPIARARKVAGRERIDLHPQDAAARGIAAGDVVRVFNDRGACLAGAHIDTGIKPGVVVMATGAWFDPAEGDAPERHGNPNVLAPDIGTSRLSQGPSALSIMVEVERFAGEAPRVLAHEPPQIEVAA